VLDGDIRRGDGQIIQSVIWFSDLRGSTDLSMAMDGPDLIALLNDFFGAVTGAVTAHGGEVLKFIGDAVLAIFPCADLERMGCQAANSAEAAARDAMERVGRLNAEARASARAEINFGIALHVGEVYYGNVGGENRLDFTVIGPAVNLASRIESLCRDTGEPFLVSDDFARLSNADYRPLGAFQLKGVEGWQTVHAPALTAE
jgi:adenylate cyclase